MFPYIIRMAHEPPKTSWAFDIGYLLFSTRSPRCIQSLLACVIPPALRALPRFELIGACVAQNLTSVAKFSLLGHGLFELSLHWYPLVLQTSSLHSPVVTHFEDLLL